MEVVIDGRMDKNVEYSPVNYYKHYENVSRRILFPLWDCQNNKTGILIRVYFSILHTCHVSLGIVD